MTRRRKILLVIAAATLSGLVVVAILHVPPVQNRAWEAASAAMERSTGFEVEAGSFSMRLLPARIELENIVVSTDSRAMVSIEAFSARWKWLALARMPHRLEVLEVRGVEVHSFELPESGPEDTGPVDVAAIFETFEIGSLTVSGGRGAKAQSGFEISAADVGLEASLVGGKASASLEAETLAVAREGRNLSLGPVRIVAEADAQSVQIAELAVGDSTLVVDATGAFELAGNLGGRSDIRLGLSLLEIGRWWDPNLVSGLDLEGTLELEGFVAYEPEAGLSAEFIHQGQPIRILGYGVRELELDYLNGGPRVGAAHPDWGRFETTVRPGGDAQILAQLDGAPIDRLIQLLAPRAAAFIGSPARLSGEVDANVAYPVVIDQLSGRLDLELESPEGRTRLVADGSAGTLDISQLAVELAGSSVNAAGRLTDAGVVAGSFLLEAAEPGRLVALIANFRPELTELQISGGPLEVSGEVAGSIDHPSFDAKVVWTQPEINGVVLEGLEADAAGTLDALEWELMVVPESQSMIQASGTAGPLSATAQGTWSLESADLHRLASMMPAPPPFQVAGTATGSGSLAVGTEHLQIAGSINARDVAVEQWSISSADIDFDAGFDRISIPNLRVEAYGGVLQAAADVVPEGFASEITGNVSWRDIDLASLPMVLPQPLLGKVGGDLRFTGDPQDPFAEVSAWWIPSESQPLVRELKVDGVVENGVLKLMSPEIESLAGPIVFSATVPLGGFERPLWLVPSAPTGEIRSSLVGYGLRTGALQEVFGYQTMQTELKSDLRIDAGWDPASPDEPRVLIEAEGLTLSHPSGELKAEGPVVALLNGRRLELRPTILSGLESRIEAEAVYDPGSDLTDGRLRARIAPAVARMLPVSIQVDGAIEVDANFRAPASIDQWADGARGTVRIDHVGGTISMRDPPLQIKDLEIDAMYDRNGLSINDGRAMVNRGSVEIGGGWDPKSGQGVVAEIGGVTVFSAGILTKWSGNLAIEPDPRRVAHVAGDLSLLAGLWDENVALAGAFLSQETLEIAADDVLHEISLDIAVRGRAGIRVDNNLGKFNTSWDVIRVGGTAAEPVLEGEVRIESGGSIALAGNRVQVRRGSLEFTGDPSVDPIVEIVPESEALLFGGDDGGVDATLLATRGVASGVSSALGFENETLQPADIAVQIERDPSTQFMVGQRVTRNLALFFGANLTDVQDRTTMVQAWNFRGLRGLVLQGYQETLDSNLGANLIQQFRWGGNTTVDKRPTIHRLRLEGEWPVSKRSLRKSTRLRRGQLFDPFLLFVAAVRMERRLAESGFQEARVLAEQRGSEEQPSMVFTVVPGQRQLLKFVGDEPPGKTQREVTALFRTGPLERASFANMKAELDRYFATEGFAEAKIDISRQGPAVVVEIDKGTRRRIVGLVVEGVPAEVAMAISNLLGSGTVVAMAESRPEELTRAVERLLHNDGFLEAKVDRVRLEPLGGGTLEAHVAVTPGPRATIDAVVLVGRDPLGLLSREGFGLHSGLPLDRLLIDTEVRSMRRAYFNAGYRDAKIRSVVFEESEDRWQVMIDLDAGAQRKVRVITLDGTRGLSDRVLRRGLTIGEGEILTDAKLDESAARIANFAPVERVTVNTVDRGNDEVEVVLDVEQRRRWSAEVGVGWSSERGVQTRFGIVDGNLFARGIKLNLRGSFDRVDKRAFLIGSMPTAPGSRISLISTLGYSIGEAPDEPDLLEQEELLASFEAQYAAGRNTSLGVYYRWTDTHTYEKVPDDFFPLDINLRVGLLGIRTVRDRYDNLIDPRSGYYLTSDLGWSSESIGSDLEYVSWLTNFGVAIAPFSGATWLQTVRVGVAEPLKGTNLDREARFFAGGQASIRGFDLNSVGPLSFGIDGSLVPAGGGGLFILNEELRIPVYGPFRAAVFADIGQVWDSWSEADTEFSIGLGAGVRWSTPIGPLWADVAWPVANTGVSSRGPKYYIGIGRTF